MKNILKKLALLAIPVLLWLAFFIAFEPNNYFGLKASATSSQPVARVRAYQQEPGTNLILGDSRLAHFDMGLVDSLSGQSWQNLAFGGASLKETLDLADYLLDSGHDADTLLVEVSFYTLNAGYNTDRFATLEETLNNPLAYCFNLEYNVNALTVAMDTLRGTPDTIESGDWVAADYLADDGTVLPLHRKLYDYTATITPRCKSWALNDEQFNRLHTLARRCQSEGVRLIVVLPPMADNVRTEVCDVFGITETMQGTVLPTLAAWADECGFTLLDYEWGGSVITDDDKQFFDGFHLDERYGLPEWTQELFGDIARMKGFPFGGSCPRSGRMRAKFSTADHKWAISISSPLIRPCGATFSLRAKSRLRRLRSDTRLRAQPLEEGFLGGTHGFRLSDFV